MPPLTPHEIAMNTITQDNDPGAHYRFMYKGIKLDPFRIARVYRMKSFAMMTILKKCLCAGDRGHKDYKQDLLDIISACNRELEILEEDEEFDGTDY